jgi:hypothetical protein
MENSDLGSNKFYQVLWAMPPQLRMRFREFMCSPYHNSRPQLLSLFDILYDCVSNSDGSAPLKSIVYSRLFNVSQKSLEFNHPKDAHLRKLLSDLKTLADRFLAVEGFLSKEVNSSTYICEAYKSLGLDRHFELAIKHALESISINEAATPELIIRHGLETLQYEYLVAKREWNSISSLPNASLTIFYHVEKYKQLCEALIFNRVVHKEVAIPFDNYVPGPLPDQILDSFPIAKFYSLLFSMLSKNTGDFDTLLGIANKTCTTIDREEGIRMLNFLQNYCSGKINEGDLAWRKNLIHIYRWRMEVDRDILPQDLINFVTAAVQEKELMAAELIFRSGYQKLVDDADRTVYDYLSAYLLYAKGESRAALLILFKIPPSEPLLELSVRILKIKIFWEDRDDEFALTSINNIIQYLERNTKLPRERREPQIKRFKMARRIIHASFDPSSLHALKTKIEEGETLPDQDYLIERIVNYLR